MGQQIQILPIHFIPRQPPSFISWHAGPRSTLPSLLGADLWVPPSSHSDHVRRLVPVPVSFPLVSLSRHGTDDRWTLYAEQLVSPYPRRAWRSQPLHGNRGFVLTKHSGLHPSIKPWHGFSLPLSSVLRATCGKVSAVDQPLGRDLVSTDWPSLRHLASRDSTGGAPWWKESGTDLEWGWRSLPRQQFLTVGTVPLHAVADPVTAQIIGKKLSVKFTVGLATRSTYSGME
jgi:hypothetical protein